MKLINEIKRLIKEENFSGVVAIDEKNIEVFSGAYGYADRANERPIDLETKFGIASGTKFFTALAIAKLVETGHLSFSDKALAIIKYPFKDYSKDFTIEHLLNHTSGMPDYYDEDIIEDFSNFQIAKPWYQVKKPADYFSSFPDGPMTSTPGTLFKYNNGGYVLLAAIIEEISGKTYGSFLKEELFSKIGMTHTGLYAMNDLPKNTANGYLEDGSTNVYKLPIIGGGDGGAFTTLKDIKLLWDALYSETLFGKDLTRKILTPQVKTDPVASKDFYGFGALFRKEAEDIKVHSISGIDAGVSFVSAILFDKNIRYTVLSNTENGAWSISKAIRTYYT